MDDTIKDQASLRDRLELPRAILTQLRDTRLFTPLVDQAIEDIDCLLTDESVKK